MKNCTQCGKCCKHYSNGGLSASDSEIEFWEIFRPAIFEYVHDGKIWMDPVSGEQLKICPWLRQPEGQEVYTCAIYFDRPDDCKQYPVNIADMIKDDCEMIEVKDLRNLDAAQKTLDKLMQDSR